MTISHLPVKVDRASSDEDTLVVRSPAVGLYSHVPEPDAILMPGGRVGQLTVLNRRYDLILPEGAWGQVRSLAVNEKVEPVEHGQILFHLVQTGFAEVGSKTVVPGKTGDAVVEGTYPILSPTDGIFYARPNPAAAAYVSVGDRVTQGQTLGLVEVMKSFNPIQYGGAGLSAPAEIVKILVEDGAEIKAEQVLFRVR